MITLRDLVDAGEAQVGLEKLIDKIEKDLKHNQELLRKLSVETIPSMMVEVGVNSITLTDGSKIEVVDKWWGALPDDSYAAFTWLRENNMDGIIKNQVIVDFGKGEDEQMLKIQEILQEAGVVPITKSTIHHMTLKAFVKEQVAKGATINLDDFGAGSFRVSVVKK